LVLFFPFTVSSPFQNFLPIVRIKSLPRSAVLTFFLLPWYREITPSITFVSLLVLHPGVQPQHDPLFSPIIGVFLERFYFLPDPLFVFHLDSAFPWFFSNYQSPRPMPHPLFPTFHGNQSDELSFTSLFPLPLPRTDRHPGYLLRTEKVTART